MAYSKSDIKKQLQKGIEYKSTYVIIACDTFSNENYPIFVKINESVSNIIGKISHESMTRIEEVYDLNKDIESQLNEYRAWNV